MLSFVHIRLTDKCTVLSWIAARVAVKEHWILAVRNPEVK